jgi:hypothetical protein
MDLILPPNSAFYHDILDETSVETLLQDRRMSSFLGNLQQISYLASYSMEIFDNLMVLAQDTSNRIEHIKLKTNNLRNKLLPEAIKRSALIDIGYGHNGLKAKERYLHETNHNFIPTVLTRDCLPTHLLEQYNKCNLLPIFSDIKHNNKYSNPDLFFKEWMMAEKARQVKAKKDKKDKNMKKKLKIDKPKRDYNKNIMNKKNNIDTKSSIVTSFLNALKGYVDIKKIDAKESKETNSHENIENTNKVNDKSHQINNTRQSTFGNISNSLRKASMFGNMFRASTVTNTLGTINESGVMKNDPFDDTDSTNNFDDNKTQGGEQFNLHNSLNLLSSTLTLNSALSTNQKNGKQKKRQSVLVNNISSFNVDEQVYSAPIITSAPPGRDKKSKKLKRLLQKKKAIINNVQDNIEISLKESSKSVTVDDIPNLKTRRRSSLAHLFNNDSEKKDEQPKLLLGNARASATRRSSFNHELINAENMDTIIYDINAKKKQVDADINNLHEANITTARRISTSHIMNINIETFDIPNTIPSNAFMNNKFNKDNMIPRPEVDEFTLPFNSSRRSIATVKPSSTKRLLSITPPKRASIKNIVSSSKSDISTPESIGPPPSDDLSIDDSLPPPDDEDDLEPPPPTPDNDEDDLEPPPTPDNEDDLEPPPPTPDNEDDLPPPPSTPRDDEDDLPPPPDYKSHPPRRSLFAAIQKSSIDNLKETNYEDQPRDSTINKRNKLLLEISNGKQELRKRNESSIIATSAGRKSISNQNVAIAAILANRSKIAGSDSDDSSISSDISDL